MLPCLTLRQGTAIILIPGNDEKWANEEQAKQSKSI